LKNLTVKEKSVFEELKRDEDLQGLRIEQERVPISYLKYIFKLKTSQKY